MCIRDSLSQVEKIYIRCGYTDMRKQLNGLLDIIQYNFKLDPYSNSLFLFLSLIHIYSNVCVEQNVTSKSNRQKVKGEKIA